MAYAMTKRGSQDNIVTYEFICDTIEDMNAIENTYRTIGSIAIVLTGESGGLEVYITGSNKQWSALGNAGMNSNDSLAGLNIYICNQSEVNEGLPDIEEPDETTIYLIPASETSGDLYDEYIYVNDTWEKFGSGGRSDTPMYELATAEDILNIIENYGHSEEDDGMIIETTFIEDPNDSYNKYFESEADAEDIAAAFKAGKNVVVHLPYSENISGFGMHSDIYLQMIQYNDAYDNTGEGFGFANPYVANYSNYNQIVSYSNVVNGKLRLIIYVD